MSQRQPVDFKSAIQKVIADFEAASKQRDAAKIASCYTEDATLLPPGSPAVKGRSHIQAFWQSLLEAGASDAKLRTVSVESSGELAYEVGAYDAILPSAGGGTEKSSGKYLVVWRRQQDGSIKMVADMFSPNA